MRSARHCDDRRLEIHRLTLRLADHPGIGHESRQPRNTWPWQLRLLSPPWLLLGSLALSASLWAIPWGANIHTGFSHKVEITPDAALVLGSWYLLIVCVGVIGFEVGRRLSPIAVLDRFPAELYYRYFTVIGAIGVAYTYGTVMVGDPMLIVDAVRHRTFNDVRLAFDYAPGVPTLRYATILAGGIALYEVCFRSKITRLAVLNLLLLALSAAATSRLSLLMAVLIAVGLAVEEREIVHRLVLRILLLAVLAFAALTAFNYLRNANFYEEYYDVRDPFTMNLGESVAYLGAPFQASIAAAGRAAGQNINSLGEELVPNPGGETGTVDWVAYDGGVPPTPTVGRVDDPGIVTSGKWALAVRMPNSGPEPQNKFLWVSDRAAVQVAPGDRLLLRAFVSGPASARSPIRLGVRRDDGSTTQDGIAPTRERDHAPTDGHQAAARGRVHRASRHEHHPTRDLEGRDPVARRAGGRRRRRFTRAPFDGACAETARLAFARSVPRPHLPTAALQRCRARGEGLPTLCDDRGDR